MCVMILHNMSTQDGRQSKTSILSTNVDKKLVRNRFLAALCRPTGNK